MKNLPSTHHCNFHHSVIQSFNFNHLLYWVFFHHDPYSFLPSTDLLHQNLYFSSPLYTLVPWPLYLTSCRHPISTFLLSNISIISLLLPAKETTFTIASLSRSFLTSFVKTWSFLVPSAHLKAAGD